MSNDVNNLAETKIEAMDKLIASCAELTNHDIINIVNRVFSINLEDMAMLPDDQIASKSLHSLTPQAAIEASLTNSSNGMTGTQVRQLINQLFGINLDALSALEKAGISLYSKGKWMLQHQGDLFVVYTGVGDVDVKIYHTDYFTEQTGLHELPKSLIDKLLPLGYREDPAGKGYYFSSPSGDAVPDAFKGQTIHAIMTVISQAYSHIQG